MQFDWFGGRIAVVPECLGYRSFITLVVLGLVYVTMFERCEWFGFKSVVRIVASAFVVAVAGNLLRITALLTIYPFAGSASNFEYWHDLLGYLVMFAEAVMLADVLDQQKIWRK